MSETELSREQFVEAYINRARAAGFAIEATEDGVIYLDDGKYEAECRMYARPCDCGCPEKWGMFHA